MISFSSSFPPLKIYPQSDGGETTKNASLRHSWSTFRLACRYNFRPGVRNCCRFSGHKSGIGIRSLISGLPLLDPFRVRGALSPSTIYNVKMAKKIRVANTNFGILRFLVAFRPLRFSTPRCNALWTQRHNLSGRAAEMAGVKCVEPSDRATIKAAREASATSHDACPEPCPERSRRDSRRANNSRLPRSPSG